MNSWYNIHSELYSKNKCAKSVGTENLQNMNLAKVKAYTNYSLYTLSSPYPPPCCCISDLEEVVVYIIWGPLFDATACYMYLPKPWQLPTNIIIYNILYMHCIKLYIIIIII